MRLSDQDKLEVGKDYPSEKKGALTAILNKIKGLNSNRRI